MITAHSSAQPQCFTITALTESQGTSMADYVSEHTLFINAYLEKNPEQAQEQKKGRALWWDKPQDPATQRSQQEARIKQEPYFGNGM